MSTQTLQSAPMTAASPRVNLMPPEIAEAAKFRQVQILLGVAVLAAVAIVAVLYLNAHSGVSGAQNELNQAQAQNASLQQQLQGLQSVQNTLDEVQSKQSLLATAMGTEVRWSFVLSDLAMRMPSNVWLTSMDVQETASSNAAVSATGPATLGAPTTTTAVPASYPIGTVTFAGVGFVHDDVAKWLDDMAKVKGFLDPQFTNSLETAIGTRGVVDFTGTVSLISDLFSNRYIGTALPTTPTATTPGAAPSSADTGGTELPGSTVPGTGIAGP